MGNATDGLGDNGRSAPTFYIMLLPPVNIPEDGAECHLGTVSQMAVHRGGRGRDGKSPDEISDIVLPRRAKSSVPVMSPIHTIRSAQLLSCNVCSHTC